MRQITKTIYEGNRKPLTGYGMDLVPGYKDGACGEYCEYNPEEAKKLFDKSGWTGPIQLTSNADGGHKEWIEAACGIDPGGARRRVHLRAGAGVRPGPRRPSTRAR